VIVAAQEAGQESRETLGYAWAHCSAAPSALIADRCARDSCHTSAVLYLSARSNEGCERLRNGNSHRSFGSGHSVIRSVYGSRNSAKDGRTCRLRQGLGPLHLSSSGLE
jgi:hypothetical protein